MSSFPGRLRESNEISIDNFGGANLTSSAFFLSHCHQDHMTGLDSADFFEMIRDSDRLLFCHPITKQLLLHDPRQRYTHLEPFIAVREVNAPFTVFSESDGSHLVTVTFLSAMHCPGSVMMFFEFSSGENVIYTGDFRLTKKDWNSFSALRLNSRSACFKRIDSFYFDNTFCSEESRQIQSREDCKLLLIRIVKDWLSRSPQHKILIWSYANYGHEFILNSLHKALKMKIHVTADRMKTYQSCGAKFSEFATTEAEETRIHACVYWTHEEESEKTVHRQVLGCSGCSTDSDQVMVVKLSMMWFSLQQAMNPQRNPMIGCVEGRFTRLQYSCHSSLTEVEDAFRILRPTRAYPNVVGRGNDEQKVMNHFRSFLKQDRENGTASSQHRSQMPSLAYGSIKKDPTRFTEYLRAAEQVAGHECAVLDDILGRLIS